MSSLIDQTIILEKLANILYNSTEVDYDLLKSEYEFMSEYNTISTSLSFEKEGKSVYFEAPHGIASKNLYLCEELRNLMKAHTGGEWTSFTLTLDKEGKAHTKFHYPETSQA